MLTFANQMPQVQGLLARLRPKVASDPFLDGDGKKLRDVIRSDLHLDQMAVTEKEKDVRCKRPEQFDKERLCNNSNPTVAEQLEEVIFDNEPTTKPSLDGHIDDPLDSLEKIDVNDKDQVETKDVSQLLSELCQTERNQASVEALCLMSDVPQETTDFIKINQQGTEDIVEARPSPLPCPLFAEMTNISSACPSDLLSSLQSLHVNVDMPLCFLSEEKRASLQQRIWQTEKYFGQDVLLRLPEPDIMRESTLTLLTPAYAVKALGLQPCAWGGLQELELSWDPVPDNAGDMDRCSVADRRLCGGVVCGASDGGCFKEKFTLYKTSHMYGQANTADMQHSEKSQPNTMQHSEKSQPNTMQHSEKKSQPNTLQHSEKSQPNTMLHSKKSQTNTMQHFEKSHRNTLQHSEKLHPSTLQHSEKSQPNTMQHSKKSQPNTMQHSEKSHPNTLQHSEKLHPNTLQHSEKSQPNTLQHFEKSQQNTMQHSEKSQPYTMQHFEKSQPNSVQHSEKSQQNTMQDSKKSFLNTMQHSNKSQPNTLQHSDKAQQNTLKHSEKSQTSTFQKKKAKPDWIVPKLQAQNRSFVLSLDDPLEHFMWLRGKHTIEEPIDGNTSDTPVAKHGKGLAKVTKDNKEKTVAQAMTVGTPVSPGDKTRPSKSKIIQVKLIDCFVDAVRAIAQRCEPLLSALKQKGLIPMNHQFTAFTPDVTRFILKQHEKARSDEQNDDCAAEIDEAVTGLHCLVSTANALVHGCLQSALVQLGALQRKHQDALRGSLKSIHHQLFQTHCDLREGKIQHPKLTALCRNLMEWLLKKRQKNPDQNPKILVILNSTCESLVQCVIEVLSHQQGVSPVLHNDQADCDQLLECLEKHNCVVSCGGGVQSKRALPWSQFSLVLEYDHDVGGSTGSSVWCEACERQRIRYVGLRVTDDWQASVGAVSAVTAVNTDVKLQTKETAASVISHCQFTFIGSHKLTKNYTSLLHLLETRENVTIVERDYTPLQQSHVGRLQFADIVLDERTCVVLHDLTHWVSPDAQVDSLVVTAAALSLKYETCWIVLYTATSQKEHYPFLGSTVLNIAKLQSALVQLSSTVNGFLAKAVVSNSDTETAHLIRLIAEHACVNSQVWNREKWINRAWLTPDITKHEEFLLALPCLNSFSAQILLVVCSLKMLLTSSVEELVQLCPWLPTNTLKLFHQLVNRTEGRAKKKATVDEEEEDESSLGEYASQVGFTRHGASTNSQESSSWLSQSMPNEYVKAHDSWKGNMVKTAMEEDNEERTSDVWMYSVGGIQKPAELQSPLEFIAEGLPEEQVEAEPTQQDASIHVRLAEKCHRLQTPLSVRQVRHSNNAVSPNTASGRCSHEPIKATSHRQISQNQHNFLQKTDISLDRRSTLPSSSYCTDQPKTHRADDEYAHLKHVKLWTQFGDDQMMCSSPGRGYSMKSPPVRRPGASSTPRSVAPVTPRRRLQALQVDTASSASGSMDGEMMNRPQDVWNRLGKKTAPVCTPYTRHESPPMDLGSDEENEIQQAFTPYRHNTRPKFGRSSSIGDHEVPDSSRYGIHAADDESLFAATQQYAPYKKRRLTFEKMPGAKGGQTRLSFL